MTSTMDSPSQNPGSPLGASYQFMDDSVEAGATYFYWLELKLTEAS